MHTDRLKAGSLGDRIVGGFSYLPFLLVIISTRCDSNKTIP